MVKSFKVLNPRLLHLSVFMCVNREDYNEAHMVFAACLLLCLAAAHTVVNLSSCIDAYMNTAVLKRVLKVMAERSRFVLVMILRSLSRLLV